MSYKRLTLGKSGEVLAVQFLQKSGHTILATNFRTRNGEIDIIAKKNGILVFVEVKTRKGGFLDSPLSAVTSRKQMQISRVSQEYLSKNDLFDRDARFDVIAILIDDNNSPQIEHLENAFDLSYGF